MIREQIFINNCQTDTLISLEVIRLNVEIFCAFQVRPEVTNVLVTRDNTVKPLNSEHLWVLKNLSAIERCLLLGGNFKKIYPFGTKCFVRYLWHVRYLDVRYWDISLYITSETYLFTKNESSISKHNVKEFYNSPPYSPRERGDRTKTLSTEC